MYPDVSKGAGYLKINKFQNRKILPVGNEISHY
jgi:hypothetical protein